MKIFTKNKNKEINIFNAKKISILGPSGSGKSTLAIQLGKMLNLPVYHMDMLYWKENWQKTERKVFLKQLKQISKSKKWITDGTYSRTLKNRFKRSDLLIYLNYGEEFCIQSVTARFLQDKSERVGFDANLEETQEGLNDLYLGIKKFYSNKSQTIEFYKNKYAKHKFLEFKTREQLTNYLSNVNK